jgi:UDP-N-acetyl-2-amino-2-deoxyglucuronate dehydrogenase
VTQLRVALVGCGGMGKSLAKHVESIHAYQLVAGCDVIDDQVRDFTEQFPTAKGYTSLGQLLTDEKPDVVIVATNNVSHAALTMQAAEAGVRGVYCEKPMATNMADGRAMVEACRNNNVALVVNHQRRMLPVFVTMRRLIEDGMIGAVELIRGSCAGDMLSDGTHTVDMIRYLVGDADAKWVLGQIHRTEPNSDEPHGQGYHVSGGWRYGHPVENGAMAVVEFENRVRAEIFTGTMQPKGRKYQDFEVFGTLGRLHRGGDAADLRFLRNDGSDWETINLISDAAPDALDASLRLFSQTILEEETHPLSGDSGLKDLEIVMAVYESARLNNRVEMPLHQPRFPLELMLEGDT